MKQKYETLDDYLDDLDAIKEKIAEKTAGMSTDEVLTHFAGAERRLREKTRQTRRTRRSRRAVAASKR
jgi:hypothetical protein